VEAGKASSMSRITTLSLEWAQRQHGLVTRRQLMIGGVPGRTITSRLETAYLWRVFSGVYLVGRPQLSLDALYLAAVFTAGTGAVLGGRSAACAWGFLSHRTTLDVLRTSASRNRRCDLRVEGETARRFLWVHRVRAMPPGDVTKLRAIPIATVERTLWDLSSLLPERRFRRAFLEADRMGLIDDSALMKRFPLSQGHRGGKVFGEMVRRRVPELGRTRSVLEALFLDLVREREWPVPDVNRVVLGLEVDFSWERARVIVEIDGYEFHRGREAFENDAARNNRLRASGWTVLRFTWRMIVDHPDDVTSQMEAVLRPDQERAA